MSMPAYKTPLSWEPDATHVNNPDTGSYMAWRIGINTLQSQAIWIIIQTADNPELLTNILPVGTEYTQLEDDLIKYGFDRVFFKNATIQQVEDYIVATAEDNSTLTNPPEDPEWGLPPFT